MRLRNSLERIDPRPVQVLHVLHYTLARGNAANLLTWRPAAASPFPRLDAVSVYSGGQLYVFGGLTGSGVVDQCDILDMNSGKWVDSIPLPDGMGRSHVGVACDDSGWIFAVSGQPGPGCGPATSACFRFNPMERTWSDLPPLPEARYAPAVQFWNGRLHAVGGSMPDRTTPASEHWSLPIRRGRAESETWTEEKPIPVPGCHRAAIVHGGCLYVIGGQQGDYVAVPGDPDCPCTGELTTEDYLDDVLRLDSRTAEWERLAPMPAPASHIESSWVVSGNRILIFGGQIFKDPESGRLSLTDAVQSYDVGADRWSVVGKLPYRVKNIVIGHHVGRLFASTGQRDRGPSDDSPRRIMDWTWTARSGAFLP